MWGVYLFFNLDLYCNIAFISYKNKVLNLIYILKPLVRMFWWQVFESYFNMFIGHFVHHLYIIYWSLWFLFFLLLLFWLAILLLSHLNIEMARHYFSSWAFFSLFLVLRFDRPFYYILLLDCDEYIIIFVVGAINTTIFKFLVGSLIIYIICKLLKVKINFLWSIFIFWVLFIVWVVFIYIMCNYVSVLWVFLPSYGWFCIFGNPSIIDGSYSIFSREGPW